MDNNVNVNKWLLVCLLLVQLSACSPVHPGPGVWIDFPFDGSVLPSGESVEIVTHASSLDGINEVGIMVNGSLYMQLAPEDTSADFVRLTFPWTPESDGDYVLLAHTISGAGETGSSEPIRVRIGSTLVEVEMPDDELAENTPTMVITPTEPITPTPPITVTPVITPTEPEPVTPTVPDDSTAPPIPSPMVPADGLVLSCASTQNLVWLPVEDPSGIQGYYVRLQVETSPDNWVRLDRFGPISGKQVEASIECGVRHRWSVRAVDNAGNESDWSAWSIFTVNLD